MRKCSNEKETPYLHLVLQTVKSKLTVSDWVTKCFGSYLYLYSMQTYCGLLNINTRCKLGQREILQ